MTGLRRISHEEQAEVLRFARAARLGQAEMKAYQQEMSDAEVGLGLR